MLFGRGYPISKVLEFRTILPSNIPLQAIKLYQKPHNYWKKLIECLNFAPSFDFETPSNIPLQTFQLSKNPHNLLKDFFEEFAHLIK